MTQQAVAEMQNLQRITAQIPALTTQSANQTRQLILKWAKSGTFTVKSAYLALKNGPVIMNQRYKIWKLKVPPRIFCMAHDFEQNPYNRQPDKKRLELGKLMRLMSSEFGNS